MTVVQRLAAHFGAQTNEAAAALADPDRARRFGLVSPANESQARDLMGVFPDTEGA